MRLMMLSHAAEAMTGGVTVESTMAEGGGGLYARSVIQLDGDVMTAFTTQALSADEFDLLRKNHCEEVQAVLESLNGFADFIKNLRWLLVSLGIVWGLLTGPGLREAVTAWGTGLFWAWLFPVLAALFARRLCLLAVGWKARSLVASATRQAERAYFSAAPGSAR